MALSAKQIEILDKVIAEKMPTGSGDREVDHYEADSLLVDALKAAGFHRVVEAWERVPKWYA